MAKESLSLQNHIVWLCPIFTTQNIQIMHNPDDKPSNCFILLMFSNFFDLHAYMSVSHGHSTIGGIEWWLWRRKKGKKERPYKKRRPKKNERKREKGQCYYPFTTLVLQSSTMIFMIESLSFCHFHILVGIFHYRTWLVYSYNGLPQMP